MRDLPRRCCTRWGPGPVTVGFSGWPTRGKTITAMAALSCRADPSDRSEGMLTGRTASATGVEKRLNLVSGLTVVVDETRLVKDPAPAGTVLYMIPKNHGRLQARPAVDGGTASSARATSSSPRCSAAAPT